MSGVLAGCCIVITRPRDQAEGLTLVLQALGAKVFSFPVIDIAPVEDDASLRDLAGRLPPQGIAFFVSANAVSHALASIPRSCWPAGLRAATVGPSTAAALREAGFLDVLVPEVRFDSEGVLALDAFQPAVIRSTRVIVFRGDGGRELLADTLRERGAEVEQVCCYRRKRAELDTVPLISAFRSGELDALVFSSSEGVRYFMDLLGDSGREMLARLPAFAPHPRIGEELKRAGAQQLILTEAGDTGIARTIAEHLGDAATARLG